MANYNDLMIAALKRNQSAYTAGKINRSPASQIAVERGWAVRRTPTALQRIPSFHNETSGFLRHPNGQYRR